MSRKNRFLFSKCHPGGSVKWLDCTIAQRGLLQLLWSEGEPADDGSQSVIEIAGSDPASHLTMRLNIRSDRERKSTTRSIRELMGSFVHVTDAGTVEISADSRRTASAQRAHSRRTADIQPAHRQQTDQAKPAQLFKVALTDRSDRSDQIREIETREREESPRAIPVVAAGASSVGSLLSSVKYIPEPTERGEKPPEVVGFLFVASLLGRSAFDVAPVGSWRSEYGYLGSRPAEERERVASVVNTTEWCLLNPSRVDAKHLQKYWQKYLDGPPKPVLLKDPETEAIRAKRAALYVAQRESDKAREERIAAEAVSEEETKAHARAALAMLTSKRCVGAAE